MLNLYKIIAFIILSIPIIYISRASLKAPGSHGFYRFFAWEVMLALFLLNVQFWFHDPLSWQQVISWLLLFGSIVPVVLGVHTLREKGKPVERRAEEPQLLAFEKTTHLVTTGIYHYIRHPLYSSLFLLNWGIFFKQPGWAGLLLALAASLLLVATARADEAECTRFFGPAYQEYMKVTKMFLPYIF